MRNNQPGILSDVPAHARYVLFQLPPGVQRHALEGALRSLAGAVDGEAAVLGVGPATVSALGAVVPGLREPQTLAGPGVSIPATPAALLLWLRGDDPGGLVHRSNALCDLAAPAFVVEGITDAFRHREGRDLTGYEDGTENPKGDDAQRVALMQGAPGIAGGSLLAVQKWAHDLRRFAAFPQPEQDAIIGRRISDNAEIEDAPESAHVKRTAQERFDPEAFVLRRSMPWAGVHGGEQGEGLVFTAFAASLDPFEAQLRAMAGVEDGVTDALFRFTRPLGTSYFWCPPLENGRMDMRTLGL